MFSVIIKFIEFSYQTLSADAAELTHVGSEHEIVLFLLAHVVHYLHIILFRHDYFSVFSSEIIWSLCSFHKTKYGLLLLKVDSQDRSPNLKIVFKHLIQMKRCLDLHQSSKFRCIIFDVKLPRIIFVNMCV